MRAIECPRYGPPEVLRLTQVEKPTPRADEVLIRVVATTVHVGDVRIRTFDVPRGQRLVARLVLGIRRPKHPILGMELAGVVESAGKEVTLFKKGDEVEAVVLKIDKENEKFSLGIKQLTPNPWDDIQRTYPLGTEIEGEVTSVTDFGAFVRLADGIEGLIYTSELSPEPVEKPADVVKAGDRVSALVTRVDPGEQKISLSIKAVHDQQQRQALRELAAQQSRTQRSTLGDLLAEKLSKAGQPDSE